MPSIYVPLQGTAADLSMLPSTGKKGVIAYTTDTQEIYTDTGSGIGIPAAWKLQTGGGSSGVASLNSLTGALTLESTDSSITITPSGTTINLKVAGSAGPNFADNEILAGSGTAWTFVNAPISALPASTSVHLYAQEYNGGPFVRLPSSAITSITGSAMVTAASWTAGVLMADYSY